MITSETPYKLADIIRDTWPQLYRPAKKIIILRVKLKRMIDYWIVIEKRTGKIIAHCGEEQDALMMINLDKHNRICKKQRFILDQIITIPSTRIKELPGQIGLPASLDFYIKEGEGHPVIV